jgi:hypothetical protein
MIMPFFSYQARNIAAKLGMSNTDTNGIKIISDMLCVRFENRL